MAVAVQTLLGAALPRLRGPGTARGVGRADGGATRQGRSGPVDAPSPPARLTPETSIPRAPRILLSVTDRSHVSKPTHWVEVSLDLLILRSLALEPMHGWAIAQRIRQVSGDVLQVGQGALYPALHKLEQQGWITAEWANSENNRRAKYYTLPPVTAGRRSRTRPPGGSACRPRSRSWCARPDHAALAADLPPPAAIVFCATRSTRSSTKSSDTTSSARSTSTSPRGMTPGDARLAALRAMAGWSNGERSVATCAD